MVVKQAYRDVVDMMTKNGINSLKAIHELQTYCEDSNILIEEFDYGNIKDYYAHFLEPEHVKAWESKEGTLVVKKIMRCLERVVEVVK